MTTVRDRAGAALYGLAVGDALGMPTQLLSPEEVIRQFGTLAGFEPAADDHPIAAGLPAGSITDDTEQALLLARALIEGGGHVDAEGFARSLLAWEDSMKAKGSLDLLGPSTKAAVAALIAGAPAEDAGRHGTTNGAAMRAAPIGIVAESSDLGALVDLVVEASAVTHNTSLALSGASAVAAAVSAGIDGATCAEAVAFGIAAAKLGAGRGHWVAGASVAARIELAISLADASAPEESLRRIREVIGTSLATQESVPAAFGILALFDADPWTSCLAAAAQGGDSDTIGAMAGAIAGALRGMDAMPTAAIEQIRRVNRLDLGATVDELVGLRARRAS